MQSRPDRNLASLLKLSLVCSLVGRTEAIYARSEEGQSPPAYCTVFHHMVKSAGSTIKNALKVASVNDRVPGPSACARHMGRDEDCTNGISSAAVITGFAELIREPLELAGRRDCEYFTMMRDPIDRLVSAFFYCPTDHDLQNRPAEWCGFTESDVPATERLLDFAKNRWKSQGFRQMSYGLFCPPNALCEASGTPGPFRSLDEPGSLELLQQVRGIFSSYTAIGIVEYYDLSMQLFNARVKSPVQDWTTNKKAVNQGQTSGLRHEVLRWARSSPEIHRVLEADLLLYAYCVALFKRQTEESLGTVWTE